MADTGTSRRPFAPDREAVNDFAQAMLARLDRAAKEGRGGWQGNELSSGDLQRMLAESLAKKHINYVSVANYIMMMWHRGDQFSASKLLMDMHNAVLAHPLVPEAELPQRRRTDVPKIAFGGKVTKVDTYAAAQANARQVGGDHYKGRLEPWDVAVAWDMDFLSGTALKYLGRAGRKEGVSKLEDLEKTLHYIQKAIEVEKAKPDASA